MKFTFTRDQQGMTYGVSNALSGSVVDLDPDYAREGVESGLLAPYEAPEDDAPKPKRGRPGKAG